MSSTKKSSDYLFSEFEGVSSKEWKQNIQAELKGKDYNETLVWESLEGIKVKPFYHVDEVEYLKVNVPKTNFEIAQTFYVDSESITNKIALEALEKGAETIIFTVENGFDADVLLQGFEKTKVKRIVFQLHYLAPHFIKNLKADFPKLPIELQIDPIGNLAATGNWFINEKQDFAQIGQVIKETSHPILTVDASVYQNAGANMVQQIAYALAHADEYLKLYGEELKNTLSFNFAVGSNYFFEIAKLRAFRYLWEKLVKEHGVKLEAQVFTKPSLRNKSLYDYNVNILRTCTENMSAVLGGANVVNSLAYDSFFKKSNVLSERIARNQLILLKAENEFDLAQNYPNGSYYIEQLTLEMTKKALEVLQDIDQNGGFVKQLLAGTIQKKIKESAQKEQELFDTEKITLLGVNKYSNPKDLMKDQIEILPFAKIRNEKTEISPILSKRLAEKIEQERLQNEQILT